MDRTDSKNMTATASSARALGKLSQVGPFALFHRSTAMLPIALAAIIVMALLARLDLFILKGGLEADQVAWAYKYYLGGLTEHYLSIRDAILSWTAERQPWSYLPGYPAFLALIRAAGVKDLASVRLIQAVIDALAILPLYFVLRSVGSSIVPAFVACSIYAVAPWWAAGSTFLLGESLLPALMIFLLAGMVAIGKRADSVTAWLSFGILSSILAFFRSDMILLAGPLIIWALLVSPRNRRVSSAACVAVGFILPLLLWGTRNYFVHGQFLLTPSAKWYAAWSGLGQVANEFRYFVSDERAAGLLKSHGIQFNSAQSEVFWHAEYWRAWADHPGHVIRTILYRFGLILGEPDSQGLLSRLAIATYRYMAYATAIVLIWLVYRRRWAEAFLIALPMAYALGSLGFLYVELRYVRYAGLTYLFALAIVLSAAEYLALAAWPGGAQRAQPKCLRTFVGVAFLLAAALGCVHQLRTMTKAAEVQGLVGRLDVNSVQFPFSGLDDLAFQPAVPGVEIVPAETGLRLRARVASGSYLALAPLRAQESGVAVIRYRAAVQAGAIGIGVLSAGGDRWLSHQSLPDRAAGAADGGFVSAVEPGSQLVIDAQNAADGVEAVVSKLQWTLACPRPEGLLGLFLSNKPVLARECSPARGN